MSENIWGYQPTTGHTVGNSLIGYKVEATDGTIGKVDKHSDDVGSAYLVVDTGVWIFGKHVLLPAGTVTRVDAAEEKIYVNRTKDEIKDAPEFDKDKHIGDAGYHDQIGGYYGSHRA
ncbi:PRC-barrel domain-containing protein [Streptomyces sp. A3M-1-3]|uniref:PRC-barrel domain-containing protein n=1 Tax=Streptomyces sp. A3M-1-3 TaxID=2962044 RepID=UPI0020B8CB42|nr:PRC-barrel domain-containing protein [Streptomyces sp. A3M-1-3]MCP3822244.1 PRC-barrel domain-containing protein [Streptomyces sp. A3M-1-3]